MTREEILQRIEQTNAAQFEALDGRQIISVSSVKEYIKTPFDKEKVAATCAVKGAENPDYKYAGMTAEEIIASWEAKADESKRYGTMLDEYTEKVFGGDQQELDIWKLDNNFDYDARLSANCRGFDEFWNDLQAYGYEYVGREIKVYGQTQSGNNVVTGRIDCLFRHKINGKLFVVDWKTSEEIKTSSFGKKMKGPAFLYDDCELGEYTFQIQVYKNNLVYTYRLDTEENVNCCIVNLLRSADAKTGKYYKIYGECLPFSHKTIDDIVDFAIKKRELMKAREQTAV